VRIKQNSFLFSSGDIGYFGVLEGTGKTLWISGGWSGSPGLCTTHDGDSGSTILSANGQRRVFAINASTTFTGTIRIENLTFLDGFSNTISSPACLSLGEQTGGLMGIIVERVWVEGCTTTSNFNNPVVSLSSSTSMVVRNSVVVNNNSGVSVPFVLALKGGAGFVLNNTIANNTSAESSGWVGLFASASNGATVTLGNNLFDGNVATAFARVDIRLPAAGFTLQNNRFTGLSGTPDVNTGSSTGSAGFNGSGYDLSASSTARDAGAFFTPILQGTLDVAAQARVQGSAVELGALEYPNLFRDGFESP